MREFALGIASNLVANLVLASIVAVATAAWAYTKFSRIVPMIRKTLRAARPDTRVLYGDLGNTSHPAVVGESPFVSPLTAYEVQEICTYYAYANQALLHNGQTLRLDSAHPRVQMSRVGFYDLVTTNLTVFPGNIQVSGVFRRLSTLRRWLILRPTFEKARRIILSHRGRPQTVDDVLTNPHLANSIALSALVVDSEGVGLIVERSSAVAVASGLFAATCSGTLSEEDLQASDPFEHGVSRELREETGVTTWVPGAPTLVMPKQKYQPVVAYFGSIQDSWRSNLEVTREAVDAFEAQQFLLIDLKDLNTVIRFLRRAQCSDTLAFQLWRAAASIHGEFNVEDRWRRQCRWGWLHFRNRGVNPVPLN